jgi:hypothetical protein
MMRRPTLVLAASLLLVSSLAACKKKGELKQDVVVRDGRCVRVSTCVVNAKTDPTPAECDPPPPAAEPTECPENLKAALPTDVKKAQGAQDILNQGAAATASATSNEGW